MKLTGTERTALLEQLLKTKVGKTLDIKVEALLPGLPEKPQLVVVKADKGKYWEIGVFFCGISVCDLAAEVHAGNLLLEVV